MADIDRHCTSQFDAGLLWMGSLELARKGKALAGSRLGAQLSARRTAAKIRDVIAMSG